MSVENELEVRLNLQEGDEFIFAESLYNSYRKTVILRKLPEFSKSQMNGYVIVKRHNGKMGMYNNNGEVVIPEDDHKCWPEFYYGLDEHYHEAICIEKEGKVEVRSCDGRKVIVPRKYKKVVFTGRFIGTTNNDITWGAYSYEGKELLKPEYYICYSEDVGKEFILICSKNQYLYGVYSSNGEEIIPCEHKMIRFTKDHQALFVKKVDGTECMYSVEGEPIIVCQADTLRWNTVVNDSIFANGKFSNDFILASKNKIPVGLYRYTGTKVIVDPANYSKMYLEKGYIICIGKDGVSMDVYDFEGDKILEHKP